MKLRIIFNFIALGIVKKEGSALLKISKLVEEF